MSLAFPLISIFGETAGKILDKLNFNKNKIDYKSLTVISFFVMLVLSIGILLFTEQPPIELMMKGYILVGFMILISTLQNITDIIGLSKEDLSLREPISNFGPLMAGLIAFIIFPVERNVSTLVFVIIGAGILIWTNTKRHHFKLLSNKGTRYFLYSVILGAILTNIYKAGLDVLNPTQLFFFRMIGVFALTGIFLRPNLKKVTKPQWGFSIYAGIAYFIGSLAYLFSIEHLGLLNTVLLLMVAPALKYLGCYLILKEKVTKKEIIGSFLLILLISLSLII